MKKRRNMKSKKRMLSNKEIRKDKMRRPRRFKKTKLAILGNNKAPFKSKVLLSQFKN